MRYLTAFLHAGALVCCAGQMQPGFATALVLISTSTVTGFAWWLSWRKR